MNISNPVPDSSHSLVRLMLTGFLSGIISAFVAASVLLALSDARFFGTTAGSAPKDFASDLPAALIAAFLWFLPVGIFVFAPLAKFLGAATGGGTLRLLKFVLLAAIVWVFLAVLIYLTSSPLAPPTPGVQRNDLKSAALSGILFAIVYDLLLRRRDYLIDRRPR